MKQALAQLPSKTFGQLAKYVNSLNKDVVDEFNRRRVRSSFFGGRDDAGDELSDANYQDQLCATARGLYTGVIINFNQRSGVVDVVTNGDDCGGAAAAAALGADVHDDRCGLVQLVDSEDGDDPCMLLPRAASLGHGIVQVDGHTQQQRGAIAHYLQHLSRGDAVFKIGAAELYMSFLDSRFSKMCVMSNTTFGRAMGAHAANPRSGIVKRRGSANGGQVYVIDPVQLRRYVRRCCQAGQACTSQGGVALAGGSRVSGAAGQEPDVVQQCAQDEVSCCMHALAVGPGCGCRQLSFCVLLLTIFWLQGLAADVDNFVRCCLQMQNGIDPKGVCLNSLVKEFEIFTGRQIQNISQFKKELSVHLREIKQEDCRGCVYYPKDKNQCVIVAD